MAATKQINGSRDRRLPRAGASESRRPGGSVLIALAALLGLAPASWAQQPDPRDGTIEEVVVTARKRSENLQSTPLAITAITSERISDGAIRDLSEAARLVPNLHFNKVGGFSGASSAAVVFIRGAGQSDFILPADPGVGVYLDGVYHARMVGAALDLADAERVEVLRGPQGSLFGRNTIGGAINVISKQPEPQFSSFGEVTAGMNNHFAFKGAVNVPLNEQFAWRLSGQRRQRGGYVDLLQYSDDHAGEENLLAVRQQLRFQRDRIDSTVALDFNRERERGGGPWVAEQIVAPGEDPDEDYLFGTNANINQANLGLTECLTEEGQRTNPLCFGPSNETGSKFKSNNVFFDANGNRINPTNETKSYGVAWTTQVELQQGLEFKSISSYRKLDANFTRSLSQTRLQVFSSNTPRFDTDEYSQELQLLGSALGDRLKWVTGVYGFREDGVQTQDYATSLYLRKDTRIEMKNTSLALFSSGTLDLTDRLQFTLGGRLTDDHKVGHLDVPNFFDPIAEEPAPTFLRSARRTRAFSPSANLSFQATPDVMTYASISQGSKNGTFAARLPFPNEVPKLATSKPEHLTMGEIGVKSDLLDDRLRMNLASFYGEYRDIQITYEPLGQPPLVGNTGAARVYGIELEMQALPTSNLQLTGTLGLLHSEYTELDPLPTPHWSRHTRLQRSPHYQASFGANYTLPLPQGSLVFNFDWQLVAKQALDVEPAGYPYALEGSWNSGNASIGFLAPGDRWGITLHVQNLTDEAHKIGVLDGSRDTWGVAEAAYNRPREVFVSVNRRF